MKDYIGTEKAKEIINQSPIYLLFCEQSSDPDDGPWSYDVVAIFVNESEAIDNCKECYNNFENGESDTDYDYVRFHVEKYCWDSTLNRYTYNKTCYTTKAWTEKHY